MWLIAGLGNPGEKYSRNWHNCGFMALDVLSHRHKIAMEKAKFNGRWGQGNLFGEKVILLRPHTFMNLSGESIREFMRFFKIPSQHLIVLYDDIDIPKGTVRVRPHGSAGTHNGMRSIIGAIGTEDFPRVRIGCGPVPEHWQLADYVLSDIPSEEIPQMKDIFSLASDKVESLIRESHL